MIKKKSLLNLPDDILSTIIGFASSSIAEWVNYKYVCKVFNKCTLNRISYGWLRLQHRYNIKGQYEHGNNRMYIDYCIYYLPYLTSFQLAGRYINSYDVWKLTQFSNLHQLELSRLRHIDDLSFKSLSKLNKLTDLSLDRCNISSITLTYILSFMPLIKHLSLGSCYLNDDINCLHDLNNLVKLDLAFQSLSHSTLISIEKSNIMELNLLVCEFDLLDYNYKYKLKLDKLILEGESVDDSALCKLCNEGSFNELIIVNTNLITDNGIHKLSPIMLKQLYIEYCETISDNGIINMVKKFPSIKLNFYK